MKYLKRLGLAAVAAMAFTAFAVSSASATTLETTGVTKNETIKIAASLKSGTSALLSGTFPESPVANTCTSSHVHGYTLLPFTGSTVTGTLTGHTMGDKISGEVPSDGLSFSGCHANLPNPTVHDPGTLYIEHESGTTNAIVFSEDAQVTVPTTLGFTVNCTTGAGTKIGTMTGGHEGNTTLHINAVLNCGFLLPSALWTGTYVVTTPTGLGFSA